MIYLCLMANKSINKGVNSIKFNQRFKNDYDCFEYLSQLKWKKGFVCNTNFIFYLAQKLLLFRQSCLPAGRPTSKKYSIAKAIQYFLSLS